MTQRRVALVILSGLCLIVLGAGALAAEESASSEGGAPSGLYDTLHNPTPWLQMGLDFRFRSIYAENIDTLDKQSEENRFDFQRYRTRWTTKWILGEDVDFNTRLTWEFRTWDDPPRKPQDTDLDEVLFDNFYFTMRNLFGMPLTATIGRQDMLMAFGVGWLVMDGTPLDGSRTFFLDAARFTFDWENSNTKLDLVYIDHAAESDRWLKPISDENLALTEQDERGAIVYLTNKSWEKTQLEAFFMYKNDNPLDATVDNMPAAWTRKAEIFTFGGAISGTPGDQWKYRVEGAIQTGEKSEIVTDSYAAGEMQDLEAYGALANLEYLFNDELENSVHIGGEYASGDDPDTSDNEQFDLLWAEWPRWSELYIYTYTKETMIAESTNLIRLNVGHKFKPNKQWQICTDYHALWADEGGVDGALDFDQDPQSFRGHLITCWAKYNLSKHVKGHLLGEYFLPGDYYDSDNNDDALFLRFNLEYTF